MGSKGLKAVVVDKNAQKTGPIQDTKAFKDSAKIFAQAVAKDDFTGDLAELGSAVLVEPINAAGAFPTRNARAGQFEDADKISGETMAQIIKNRGGKQKHKGCAQCIISCSNEYVDEQGKYVTSSLEYETIWSMGGMLGNNDLDAIAKLDFLCDDIGLDTISTGVAIAVAMDAGYREFGDAKAAIEMVEEVAEGRDFGKILGHGPERVGKHFNHDRVPVVKGQSIAAYDPRAIQGMAVTYATSPMGADHTAGFVVESNLEEFGGTLDRFSAEGQVEASRDAQIHMVLVDTVGICDFAQTGFGAPDGVGNVCKMIAAKSGKPFTKEDWTKIGKQVLQIEVEFNRKAGFTKEQDRLPKMFYEEPLPPHNKVVVISDEEMDTVFNFFKK
jgi:aldehyde:ferredoxin oxidoreductase